MDAFRNLLKGWFGKCLLVLFILPFAFFGIEGIFQGVGRSNAEVVVNGVEITKPEVDRAAELQRRNLAQRMGGNIDPSVISLEMVRPAAIEYLIRKALLNQAVSNEGFFIAQEEAKDFVRAMPQFKDETGEFSSRRLEQLLAQAGYTGLGFFNEVREEMLIKQLQTGIMASAFVTPSEVEDLVILDKQTRDISTLEIKAASFRDSVEVTDEDINIYYQANSEKYQTPEKVKVEYLHVSLEDFKSSDEVSEEDVTQAFDRLLQEAADKERRRAQHILVEISDLSEEEALEKIKKAKSELDAGAAFEAVVEKYTDDVATAKLGGDLGYAARGVYDEAFDNALFSLAEGQVSDIVKTEFGYHIIKLSDIDQKDMPKLEDERDQIVASLKEEMAREAMTIALEDLTTKAFEHPETLVDAAEVVKGSTIKTTDWITRAGATGPLKNNEVITKIFDPEFIEARENSEAIELGVDEAVLVRVLDYQAQATKPLAEVKNQVKNAVVSQKSREKASEVANKLLAKLGTGTPAEEVAAEIDGVDWIVKTDVSRKSTDLSRDVIQKAFEMASPGETATYDKVQLPTGDQVVVAVSKVVSGNFDISEEEKKQIFKIVESRYGQYDFANYIETLRDSSNIEKPQS